MQRLNEPNQSFRETLEACDIGITGNAQLKDRIRNSRELILQRGPVYLEAAAAFTLFLIPPILFEEGEDPVVVDEVTRSDLIKLYDQYFVGSKKPARKIYNELMLSAKEQCPFCGGIGRPRNLDHYLPKSEFPQYSVFPLNLVPACRDCNMEGKGRSFATAAEFQIIHPYCDDQRFFSQQWIFADAITNADFRIERFEYFANPPEHWSDTDVMRAKNHFVEFDLAKRYSIKAAEQLGMVLMQMQRMKGRGVEDENVIEYLLRPGIETAPFVNHWQRGMYEAVIRTLE